MYNAAMNMGVLSFLCLVSSVIVNTRSGVFDPMVVQFFFFEETSYSFPVISKWQSYLSVQQHLKTDV